MNSHGYLIQNADDKRRIRSEKRKQYRINGKLKNPDIWRARDIIGNALQDGRLIKGACEICGSINVAAYHDDYAKPLDVRWLCRQHKLERNNQKLGLVALTIGGTIALIPLSRGLFAIIDIADLSLVQHSGNWYSHRAQPGTEKYYAAKQVGGNKPKKLFLHNLIMNTPDHLVVDHKNGNRLDNRRSNLRLCTQKNNLANRKNRNSTGFRGVRRQRSGGYQALIMSGNNMRLGLGTYSTAEEAGRAYDAAAKKMFGEFATLNFPEANL